MWLSVEFLAQLEVKDLVGNDHHVSHCGLKTGRSPRNACQWEHTLLSKALPKGWVWRRDLRVASSATARISVVSHVCAYPNC